MVHMYMTIDNYPIIETQYLGVIIDYIFVWEYIITVRFCDPPHTHL